MSARRVFVGMAVMMFAGCGKGRDRAPAPHTRPPAPHAEPTPVEPAAADAPPAAAPAPAAPAARSASIAAAITGDAQPESIAIDSKGDLVVAARFKGVVDASGGVDGGEGGALVMKLSPTGERRWTKVLGTDRVIEDVRVAIDAHDAIVVTASLSGTADLGGGALGAAGDADILLAKLGPDGAHVWSRRFGGTEPDRPAAVAIDTAGNIALVGYYAAKVDFGGKMLDSPDEAEMFVASYDPVGTLRWAKRLSAGGPDHGELYDVAIGSGGQVVALGSFTDKVDLAGTKLVAGKGRQMASFVAAFTPAGALAWDAAFGPGPTTLANRVAVDGKGGVVLAGTELHAAVDDNDMVSFDVATGNASQGSMSGFVAALGPKGAPRWNVVVGDHGMTDLIAIAMAGDDVAVAGTVHSGAPLGDASLRGVHAFAARLGADGKPRWVRAIPGAPDDADMTVAARGDVLVIATRIETDGHGAVAVLRAAP